VTGDSETSAYTTGLDMAIEKGWLNGVRRVVSPNCDERPPGSSPELIVVHGISLPPGEFGGSSIDKLFTNSLVADEHPYFQKIIELCVSSHVLISRLGVQTQYVPFDMRAWHAGESCYCGRERCNDFSVGIELEGTDDMAYERIQYERLAELVRVLRQIYPTLRDAEIVGHSDIAPGRKTDPGPYFDWALLRALLESYEVVY
jgi:N-acetyl-anhydromuramoyl-L-alanine amidase